MNRIVEKLLILYLDKSTKETLLCLLTFDVALHNNA